MYQSRRGHAPQISISDDNHHVTEAIGDMYGDMDYTKRDSRPLSFVSSPQGDSFETSPTSFDSARSSPPRSPLGRTMSNEKAPPLVNGTPKMLSTRSAPFGLENQNSPVSPPPITRTNSDTANQQFPLNDIDYESSPAAVAQELSNLQAIRRMSMDVNTSDPDLPSFGGFGVPPVAPAHFSDDEDPSKLFWVPARLHPELAPVEFKTFIEDKVDKIRRRSGGEESLSPDGLGRQASGGGLRRKKSMLSRQIDNASGYKDGADRLDGKRSLNHEEVNGNLENLHELEHLVEDPSSLMRSMSIESARKSSDSGGEVPLSEDIPILGPKPPGQTLKRSTRTNYRRGSLRKGERIPFSRRMAGRQSETDTEESPASSPVTNSTPEFPMFGLNRVQSEPIHLRPETPENFSRPTRKRSPPIITARTSSEDVPLQQPVTAPAEPEQRKSPPAKQFHSRIASNGRTTAPLPGYTPSPVPLIIETPPPPQEPERTPLLQLPERSSSRETPPPLNAQIQTPPSRGPPPPRQPPSRPPVHRQGAPPIKVHNQTLDDMASHPSPLPGNSTRTDSLSFIPTFSDEKKPDKKSKDRKDTSDGGTRKTSWGWFLGSDDKEKEKDRERKEKEEKETAKKSKNKLSKAADKSHDNTRLDVLQTSIDGGRGRESIVLDRESIKLEEERKKESSRKSSGGESKKEKESGIFSSLFGGGKKKGEKESTHKKPSTRGLSPDPPPRILKPDIDYNWTRFSIMEERTIYRIAHIKLANPRRELYSQVLLSNFMYSYLAKVQQMHPQIQIGHSAQQKQQQRQAQQQKKDQPEEFSQYQRYQQQQDQPDGPSNSNAPATFAETPSEEPQSEHNGQVRSDSRASQHSQASQQSSYSNTNGNSYSVASGQNYLGQPGTKSQTQQLQQPYYGQALFDDSEPAKDDEMW